GSGGGSGGLFTFGGSGAADGDGAGVSLESIAPLYTLGDDASGIFAQSLGGGGGDGGGAVAGGAFLSLAMGGSGGPGGDGKQVLVTSHAEAAIVTAGRRAYGIHAQSLGGGGGSGGYAISISAGV